MRGNGIDTMNINLCRVVLVEPQIAANIGATARVMHNMGLRDLVLVAPQVDPRDRNAQQLSTHGEHILDAARIVQDLGDAVAECAVVAGTSARTGGLYRRQNMGAPADIMPHLVLAAAAGSPVALVFGPERTGLTNEHIARCHYLIHIPTADTYAALNLAQAVAICLYELRVGFLHSSPSAPAPSSTALASFAAQEHMFAQLQSALENIHFLYGPKADSLMHALRHMLSKGKLTQMEVDVLFGLARQIHWFASNSHHTPPSPPSPV